MFFKLRAAVDLDGFDPEGKLPFEVLQEAGRGQAGLAPISPGSIPSAEKIAGAELIDEAGSKRSPEWSGHKDQNGSSTGRRSGCQWAWKIDPLWALKNDPPSPHFIFVQPRARG